MLPRLYRVEQVRREIRATCTLALVPDNGTTAFSFAPGQFTMLYVFGIGEIPISISGDPAQPHLLVHTVRAVGPVSQALQQLKRGDVIGVRGPFGSSWPIEDAKGSDVILVAGGLGLAPLRPALYALLSQREQYGRLCLLYGARTPQDVLYARELARWRGRFDLDVYVTVDSASTAWRGQVGVVTALLAKIPFDPANTVALVCGPEVMMRFTTRELQERGLSAVHIFVSMERNMKCALGFCGHCQFGPTFVCKDGPVLRYDRIQSWFGKREI
ncbi:MAG: FAD/NAD(P)-binding protein [Candidatus Binatia bacterium]|nr:FAD/NAD(P)-binding protein [Candidatus Binatia bacterium]